MEVVATWEGGYQCRVAVRQFEIVSDEPPTAGGEDAGPTPTELFLASLSTCFAMAVAHVARKRGMEIPGYQVAVSGEYDGPRFKKVRVEVRPEEHVEGMKDLLERALAVCYVSNTLRNLPGFELALDDQVVFSQD